MRQKLGHGHMMLHPRLKDTHLVTSDKNKRYNCASWAVGDHFTTKVLDPDKRPGTIWPIGIPRNVRVGTYIKAFATYNFHPCGHGKYEKGYVKIAIFEDEEGDFAHAARLLPDGKWTSKLGIHEDISHDTMEEIGGGQYGEFSMFMKRAETNEEAPTRD